MLDALIGLFEIKNTSVIVVYAVCAEVLQPKSCK